MNFRNVRLDGQKRISFLQVWDHRYPCSSGRGICGKLVFLDGAIRLERNGSIVKNIHFSQGTAFKGPACKNFDPFEVLQSGDWVECEGADVENEYDVTEILLLSPNLLGSEYRLEVKQLVREWNKFWNLVRAFFQERNFDELRTPTLVTCPGTEPFLDPFKTEFVVGSHKENLFLPTSPELHLKKCLAMGWETIFEMRPCFRNGEVSDHHQPEFYMLEWYRAFANMDAIKEDVRALVEEICPVYRSHQWSHLSMADLFKKYLNFELKPDTTVEELVALAQKAQVDVSRAVDFDEVFFFLFLEKIEPHLKDYDCLFLHGYPPSQAALARLTPGGWGDRFEFYIRGLEIANAFNELNDPNIQRQRSQEDLEKKQIYGKAEISLDGEFFRGLEGGMPPSCGIALGLDRLFMALHNVKDIRAFRLFPK